MNNRKPFFAKMAYFIAEARKNNRNLLYISVAQLPLLVLLPFMKLFMPKLIIDGITQKDPLPAFVLSITAGYLIILLLSSCAEWISGKAQWYNKTYVNTLLKIIDDKTIETDYENVESSSGQQMRQKALNAVYTGGQKFVSLWVSLFINVLGLVFYGIVVGRYSILLLIVVIAGALAGYYLNGIVRNYEQKQKDAVASEDRKLHYLEREAAAVQPGREIRLYRMAPMLTEIFEECLGRRVRLAKQYIYSKMAVEGGNSLLSMAVNLFTYVCLILMVFDSRLGAGDFILLTGLLSGLCTWVTGTVREIGEIKRVFLYFDDFFAYLSMPESFSGTYQTGDDMQEIEFQNVCFHYKDSDRLILKDINLKLNRTEKLALVGENGAGKTTLIKILTGLYKPTSGKILMNGADITEYDREDYFRCVSGNPAFAGQHCAKCVFRS